MLMDMRERAAEDAEFLFPAPLKDGPRTDLDTAWAALRRRADIPDVRLHDLRHSYASILASQNLSLPIIGALLGHASPISTSRYSHLIDTAATIPAASARRMLNDWRQELDQEEERWREQIAARLLKKWLRDCGMPADDAEGEIAAALDISVDALQQRQKRHKRWLANSQKLRRR